MSIIDVADIAQYSIQVVEHPEFQNLLLLLREELTDCDLPHQTTIHENIIKSWKVEFQKLKGELLVSFVWPFISICSLARQKSIGHISYTMDLWSNQHWASYLALTAHYISRQHDGTLELLCNLVAFLCMHGSYAGTKMAELMIKFLDRLGATEKTGHWTMDGAASNWTFLQALEVILNAQGMEFDAWERMIRCR